MSSGRVYCRWPYTTGYALWIIFLLLSVCSLFSACSHSRSRDDVPQDAKSTRSTAFADFSTQSEAWKGSFNSKNILSLYQKFDPGQQGFDELFDRNLPDTAYKDYAMALEEKLYRLTKVLSGERIIGSRLVHKTKISKRKRQAKKEWEWGKSRKEKLRTFYEWFADPFAVYEHKLAFEIRKNPQTSGDIGKEQQMLPTSTNVILFFYKKQGDKEMYLIDPDIFIKSVL